MQKILLFVFIACSFLTKAQDVDVLHYHFAISLTDKSDSVGGSAIITFVAPKKINTFAVDLVGVQHDGKGMHVEGVQLRVKGADDFFGEPSLPFEHKQNKLFIALPENRKSDTLTIRVHYSGIPADGLIISKNKYRDRTFFADNWPNRAHHWLPCVDRPNDKASFEFFVSAPRQYSVISNGIKLSERLITNEKKITSWREDTPQPTKVMVIGVAKFATKVFADSPKDIPVSAWVYPQDSAKGFYDYALATDILKFFSSYIAPFPYKKLANVQSKTIFGGMENASAIFYAENSVTGDRSSEDLLAHEIAHQWFGDMASEKSFAHLWLSEGFATYFTDLYFENTHGKDAADERLKKEREEVIEFARTSTQAVVDSTKDLMSLLNANSYQKGAWVLHMLRNEVGDSTFHQIIQTYYNQYKGANADTRDFETIAEKVSGKELTWFFDQWLYRPGIPQLQMSTAVQNSAFVLTVKQKGQPYRLTLEVDIVGKDNEITRQRFDISKKEETFMVPIKGYSASFSLDPDTKLLYKSVD